MKKYTLLFALLVFVSATSQGQDRMTEKDVYGSWKMVIELDEVMEELDEEANESESMLAKILIKSVSGIVEGVMENIEIYIDFNRNGDARVMVDAFDERSEDEDTEWYKKIIDFTSMKLTVLIPTMMAIGYCETMYCFLKILTGITM